MTDIKLPPLPNLDNTNVNKLWSFIHRWAATKAGPDALAAGYKVDAEVHAMLSAYALEAVALNLSEPPLTGVGEPPGQARVTNEMVSAYLKANDAYWKVVDELPLKSRNPSDWRSGTPREATRVSLAAALTVKSTALDSQRDAPAGEPETAEQAVGRISREMDEKVKQLKDGDLSDVDPELLIHAQAALYRLSQAAPSPPLSAQPAEPSQPKLIGWRTADH